MIPNMLISLGSFRLQRLMRLSSKQLPIVKHVELLVKMMMTTAIAMIQMEPSTWISIPRSTMQATRNDIDGGTKYIGQQTEKCILILSMVEILFQKFFSLKVVRKLSICLCEAIRTPWIE